jgi:hypothetical protein
MLDSLVRVSRRVGRATDTDAAEAVTSNVADDFEADERARRRLRAGSDAAADVPSFERALSPTLLLLMRSRYPSGPATRGDGAGNEPPSRAARPQPRRFAGLPVPVAALTVEKCVERTLLRYATTRRDSTFPTYGPGRLRESRSTDSRRRLTAPSVFF